MYLPTTYSAPKNHKREGSKTFLDLGSPLTPVEREALVLVLVVPELFHPPVAGSHVLGQRAGVLAGLARGLARLQWKEGRKDSGAIFFFTLGDQDALFKGLKFEKMSYLNISV